MEKTTAEPCMGVALQSLPIWTAVINPVREKKMQLQLSNSGIPKKIVFNIMNAFR